jgi:hypothetical protein
MASPDLKYTWAGGCSSLWSGCSIGIRNKGTLSSLTFRQTSLGVDAGGVYIENCSALTTVSFPNLTSSPNYGYLITGCGALTSITFPVLASAVPSGSSTIPMFYIVGNAALTTITMPSVVFGLNIFTANTDYDFRANALNQATVDNILERAVASPLLTAGVLQLDGGTNAAPSAAGLVNKNTLITRGMTVNTN